MRSVTVLAAILSVPAAAFAASVSDAVTTPETKGVVDVVLQHGITGAMLLIVLFGYFRKDKQLAEAQENKDKQIAAESAARVADAKANAEVMRSMVIATTTQMERFNDTAEALVNELRAERHASHVAAHPPPRTR